MTDVDLYCSDSTLDSVGPSSQLLKKTTTRERKRAKVRKRERERAILLGQIIIIVQRVHMCYVSESSEAILWHSEKGGKRERENKSEGERSRKGFKGGLAGGSKLITNSRQSGPLSLSSLGSAKTHTQLRRRRTIDTVEQSSVKCPSLNFTRRLCKIDAAN